MSNIVDHITVNGDRKLREVADGARQEGRNAANREWEQVVREQDKFYAKAVEKARQQGMSEGYSSRVKDEADARRTDTRVTAWSVGGNDDDTVSIHITGNQLDAEEAHDIAAALWHQVTVIQNRRMNK